jgi:HPt (histidine-containing phosphotransfer) domain-containing protein
VNRESHATLTNPIDPRALAQLRANLGDDATLALVVADFRQELPTLLADLRAALAAGDAGRLRRAAHTLKTTSATMGATGLAGACRRLEAAVAAGHLSDCAPGLADAEGHAGPVDAALAALARRGWA